MLVRFGRRQSELVVGEQKPASSQGRQRLVSRPDSALAATLGEANNLSKPQRKVRATDSQHREGAGANWLNGGGYLVAT